MSLRDEIIKEAESGKNGFVVISGDCAFSEKELDVIINKILDAVVEEFKEESDQVVLKGDYDEGIHDAHKLEAPRIIDRLRPKS